MRSSYIEGAMSSATSSLTPEDEVETLMQQVADTHSLDFKSRAADASKAPVQQAEAAGSGEAPGGTDGHRRATAGNDGQWLRSLEPSTPKSDIPNG